MKKEYIYMVLGILVTSLVWLVFLKREQNSNRERIEIQISNQKSEQRKFDKRIDSLTDILNSLKKYRMQIIDKIVFYLLCKLINFFALFQ